MVAKFDKVRRNIIFERAKFNRRNQREGESVEQYITALYSLQETCAYGDLADELLRSRIVVGIRDTALSEHLQLDPDLTLEKATRMVRQKEVVKQHNTQLKAGTKDDPIVVEEVNSSRQPKQVRKGEGRTTPHKTDVQPGELPLLSATEKDILVQSASPRQWLKLHRNLQSSTQPSWSSLLRTTH